ncbi:MAG: hypothetical protein IPH12_14570 [Saprospirales bacterium]|nr:hypothetical protein [Saprospirales bacterium]MBK8924001.1 hypothetical protein [Saprospirales bacterium]
MKKQDRLHDELNEQAPFLNGLRKKSDGFRVPADYFSQLESEVFRQLEAIGAQRKPENNGTVRGGWRLTLLQLWQPRLALAFAGALAVILVAWWYVRPQTQNAAAPDIAASTVTADDAAAYLLDNWMELEPTQIAVAMPQDDLPAITLEEAGNQSPETKENQQSELEISTEDLENLLRDMSDEELKNLIM